MLDLNRPTQANSPKCAYTFLGLDHTETRVIQRGLDICATLPLTEAELSTVETLQEHLSTAPEARLLAVVKDEGEIAFYVSTPDLARLPITITNADRTEVTETRPIDDPKYLEEVYAGVKVLRARQRMRDLIAALLGWIHEVKVRVSEMNDDEFEGACAHLREIVGTMTEAEPHAAEAYAT